MKNILARLFITKDAFHNRPELEVCAPWHIYLLGALLRLFGH